MTEAVAGAAPAAPATTAAAPAAPQAAPQAAPAAPQAPAAKPAEAAPAAAERPPVDWGKTGDSGLDMALGFIGQRGFGQDHPAVEAAMNGNFSLLRAELAGMGDKAVGYEAYVTLAEQAYKSTLANLQAQEQKSIEAVLSVAGTPENWAAVHAWAKANADEAERAELNAMLGGSPRQAKAAAVYLMNLYENAHGTSVQPQDPLKPTAAGGYSPSAGGPITDAKEYAKAVNELHKKLGHKMEGSAEYAELNARRLAGKRIR